jgi:uncharacterized protein (DUF302 family)
MAWGVAAALLVAVTAPATAEEQNLARMVTVEGDAEKTFNELVEQKIKPLGFVLSDPHKRVNDAYEKKYGSTQLDLLSFMSITNKNAVSALLEIDPRLAGFNPFNMLSYRKKGDASTYIGHLDPVAMMDIVGITDPKIREAYPKIFKPLDALIDKEIGGKVSMITIQKMAKKRMMNFEVPFERPEDLDDFIDSFQEKFEEAFEDKNYLIAGFFNFKETFDGVDRLPSFDAFWVYSLCHLKFSYTVFDNAGARPDAGLFAPCSMYMFIKKDSNVLTVGMPRLANWAATLGIKAKERLDLVHQLDKEIPEIMVSLGAREVSNVNPMKEEAKPLQQAEKKVEQKAEAKAAPADKAPAKAKEVAKPATKPAPTPAAVPASSAEDNNSVIIQIPEVPKPVKPIKVITLGGNAPIEQNEDIYRSRAVIFEGRTPPKKIAKRNGGETAAKKEEKAGKPGDVSAGRVSAYLRGELKSVAEVKKALEGAGFKVLSVSDVDKKGKLKSIVFTNDTLTKIADKQNRGFAASLRALVDEKNKQISIMNPLYVGRAFMQDDYDQKAFEPVLESLRGAFPGLKNSEDELKYLLLPKYRFMDAMPYYHDMVVVAKGEKLLEKAKARNGGKDIVFVQPISKERTLIGVKLGKRTRKFIKKIGGKNAALLPYPILIENGEAKILDPKYYIAVMYPMLKMSEFMTISTVPGAIQLDCENLFR